MDSVTPRASAACDNCGAALHGAFCAVCGQEARPLDPSLREVVREIGQELIDVDGRLLRSVRALFLSPGLLTRELFAGRRVRWVTPLRLYLTFSVAYFALVAMGGTNLHVSLTGSDADQARVLRKIGFSSADELRQVLNRAVAVWMPRVNFVLVPLFAALIALVRRASGRRYPQHLVFALHAHAAWFGARALGAAGNLAPQPWIGGVLDALSVLYGVIYVVIAVRVAYDVPTARAIRDAIVVLGLYTACVIVAAGAVVAMNLPPEFWQMVRQAVR